MKLEISGCMMNEIHPTAIVSPRAIIGQNNYIGPYCTVYDNVIIGNDNIFISHVSVGSPPEHKDEKYNNFLIEQPDCFVYIGNGNTFREFITINMPTDSKRTMIGNDCYIMARCHISHDTVLEDNVTMSCNSITGGHTTVMQGAVMGLGSITHQRTTIGSFAMLGMGCIVNKSSVIEPFKIYVGNPAEFLKDNIVGIERNNVSQELISKEIDRYKFLTGYL